jgi:hypothetical protein
MGRTHAIAMMVLSVSSIKRPSHMFAVWVSETAAGADEKMVLVLCKKRKRYVMVKLHWPCREAAGRSPKVVKKSGCWGVVRVERCMRNRLGVGGAGLGHVGRAGLSACQH